MDYNQRVIYAEKSKYEKYFIYTSSYLEGLNGYNLNLQNNLNISYGVKINGLMRKLVSEGFITDEEIVNPLKSKEDKENRLAVEGKELTEKEKGNNDRKGLLYNLIFNEHNCLSEKESKNETNIAISFLKKLIFFKKYENKNDILKKEEINNHTAYAKDDRIQSKKLLFINKLFIHFLFLFLFVKIVF